LVLEIAIMKVNSKWQSILEFATASADTLVARFYSKMDLVLQDNRADSIHDLRVSIRQLLNSIRIFREVHSKRAADLAKRRLTKIRKAAGAVRDRDITMQIVALAAEPNSAILLHTLSAERKESMRRLRRVLDRERRRPRCICLSST
jgi:CHAD domain-containing protein